MAIVESVREWFSSETARNKNSAIVSGILFFFGWWILVDSLSCYPGHINAGQAFIGVFGSLSFFMVNTVKNSHLSEDNLSVSGSRFAILWLLIAFVMGFASIIAAIWIMIKDFSAKPEDENWPGIAILIQNVLILIASLMYKFGRNEEDWSN